MKKQKSASILLFLSVFLALLLIVGLANADWQKMDPPPDVDKKAHNHDLNPTCWLATAANMLVGAGYGTGSTVQARADNIYSQLVTQYTANARGWSDTAVSWWLSSTHNTQKTTNAYCDVTVHGHKSPKYPWHHDPNYVGLLPASDDGPQFLGNELRRCQTVGVSISWPQYGTLAGKGGHALTAWGDSNEPNLLTANPAKLIVADSDKDNGGDVQIYTYDDFTNPNPSGYGGRGWYINYSSNHPFIKHIVTLCPVDDANDPNTRTQKIVGSYKICNNSQFWLDDATDLHYDVSSDFNILSYLTTIDWQTSNQASIQEVGTPRRKLMVDWDISDNNLPHDGCIKVTTQFVLPYSTTANMTYSNVYFAFPEQGPIKLGFDWGMTTPEIANPDLNDPNISGGYVIGAFDIYNDQNGTQEDLVAEFRFCSEYNYFQDPENHTLDMQSQQGQQESQYFVGNFRFGHSYGILTSENLWSFDQWLAEEPNVVSFDPGCMVENMQIYLPGLLPYPPAEEYIPPAQPEQCGDPGTVYEAADLNKDCKVDLRDFTIMGQVWLECTDPNALNCP